MSLNLIGHRHNLLLHRIHLLVQLRNVLNVLLPHGLLTLAGLLHDQVLLLDVLQLLTLGFLLQRRQLPATLVNFRPFSLHHLDLIKRNLELFVERMHVHKVLIRRQLLLALLETFPNHGLLLAQALNILKSLILNPK